MILPSSTRMQKTGRLCGCHVLIVLLAATVACAPKARRQASAKPRGGTRVALRAVEVSAAGGPTLRGPCPVDLTLRDLTCPSPSAVIEVDFAGDGRVAQARVARSSGVLALDLGCMLAASSCVAGQSRQKAEMECSLQCE
jgi:hypothetical protein